MPFPFEITKPETVRQGLINIIGNSEGPANTPYTMHAKVAALEGVLRSIYEKGNLAPASEWIEPRVIVPLGNAEDVAPSRKGKIVSSVNVLKRKDLYEALLRREGDKQCVLINRSPLSLTYIDSDGTERPLIEKNVAVLGPGTRVTSTSPEEGEEAKDSSCLIEVKPYYGLTGSFAWGITFAKMGMILGKTKTNTASVVPNALFGNPSITMFNYQTRNGLVADVFHNKVVINPANKLAVFYINPKTKSVEFKVAEKMEPVLIGSSTAHLVVANGLQVSIEVLIPTAFGDIAVSNGAAPWMGALEKPLISPDDIDGYISRA